jgi:hypothetical protein
MVGRGSCRAATSRKAPYNPLTSSVGLHSHPFMVAQLLLEPVSNLD